MRRRRKATRRSRKTFSAVRRQKRKNRKAQSYRVSRGGIRM